MVQPAFPVSEVTQKILKSFSQLSDHILLAEGQKQKTIGPGETTSVLAYATFPEAWPKETAIYNLASFLGVLSTFEKPVIQFEKDAMVIANDKGHTRKVKYRYSDPTTVTPIKDKVLATDKPAVKFVLSQKDFASLKKTTSLLSLTHFSVNVSVADGVTLTASDPKNPSSHALDVVIPPSGVEITDGQFTRTMRFQVAHAEKLLDGDYTVSLAAWPYAFFEHKSAPVTYFVAEDRSGK